MRYVILILVMVTVWGLLTKSLTDSETIEEMVDRKIAEHEENPEAHMGTGESIDVHRKNEIVDHKAGSILADKTTMTEIFITDHLMNMDAFAVVGEVSNYNYPEVRFYLEEGYIPLSKITSDVELLYPLNQLEKDTMFQVAVKFDTSTQPDEAFWGYGHYGSSLTDALGFRFKDGVLKGIVKDYAHEFLTPALTVDVTTTHIYRIQYIAEENILYFYIDGQKVYEWTPTFTPSESDAGILVYGKLITTSDAYFIISDMQYAKRVN